MSKKDYDKLRSKHLPAAIREKLRQCTHRIQKVQSPYYAEIDLIDDGKCALLCEGLCQLQRECGAEILSEICRVYPRTHRRIGALYLRGCHNSCEAVHALLLQQAQGVTLVRRPATLAEEHKAQTEKVLLAGHPLCDSYETIEITLLALMQNRAYSLGERLLLLGIAIKELDCISRENRPQDVTAWMLKFAALATGDAWKETLAENPGSLSLGIHNCIGSLLGLNWGAPQLWLTQVIERLGMEISESDSDADSLQMKLNLPRTEKQAAHLQELLAPYPLYLESVLINQMFATFFPFDMGMQLYDSFLALCNSYAAIRISMIAYAGESGSIQDAIDGAVYTARVLEHADSRQRELVARLHATQSDTLAHVAYLVHI